MRRSEGPAASGGCGEGCRGRGGFSSPGGRGQGVGEGWEQGALLHPSPQGLRFAPGGLLLVVGAAHRAEVKLPVKGF